MKNKQIHKKRFISVVFSLLLLVVIVVSGQIIMPAFAETEGYTSVIEDLSNDKNFNTSDYPIDTSDYSLQVIQIAESAAGELFVYVYQPSTYVGNLVATDINLSLSETVNGTMLYSLNLLSNAGVFYKYLVEGVTVNGNPTRYYNISSIYRKWDKTKDEGTGNDNTINGVSFEVGQLWTAKTVNGKVEYRMTKKDVVEISDKFVGFIRYDNGFKLYNDSCDSHFIAFSTDFKIDTLMQADVSYVMRGCKVVYMFGNETNRTYGEYVNKFVTLDYNDIGGNRADGWWANKVEYHRIESAADFANSENFDNETKSNLSKYQWVLRFAETDYISTHDITALTGETFTEISEVTILRLSFETDGVTYNLGVVDNKQTGSNSPIAQPGKTDFWQFLGNCFKNTFSGVGEWWEIAIVVVVLFLAFVAFVLFVAFLKWSYRKLFK